METVVIFDFDGVLVDSYSGLTRVYRDVAKKLSITDAACFIKVMLSFEDIMDYFGLWDRNLWFNLILKSSKVCSKPNVNKLVNEYWRLRIKYSKIMNNAKEVIEKLNSLGIHTYIVSGSDGVKGMKYKRIKALGFDKLVKEILVYGIGEKIGCLFEALSIVRRKHKRSQLFYIDDKPKNLMKACKANVRTILYKYKPPFPAKYAWRGRKPKNTIEVENLYDLIKIVLQSNRP